MLIIAMVASYLISLQNKSIVTNAITNEFIYKYLLPIIVLAEGFNMRRRSLSIYKREVFTIGVAGPFLTFFLNTFILIGLQKLAMKNGWWDQKRLVPTETIISIAITMSTVEIHGSIAPLNMIKNMRIYKVLFSSGLFNNNLCLVIVMTFERMIHSHSNRKFTKALVAMPSSQTSLRLDSLVLVWE